MLYVLMVGGWIFVAAACAVVIGKAVRSAETHDRPAGVVAESLHSLAEERGYVQPSLFDVTASPSSREPVPVS